MSQLTYTINQPVISYDIEIHQDLLIDIEAFVLFLKKIGTHFALITDINIAQIHGFRLKKRLEESGLGVHLFAFPEGESYKTRMIKEFLEDQMFESGFGKNSCIIALGGGVVTDISGFVASTFCRGIPYVSIPTTLLGMVDASLGGKNGINIPYGKNLVGTIYQPKKILINLEFLHTLPRQEFRNGVVEMIKHGLIADVNYFKYLESDVKSLFNLNSKSLEKAILTSCLIKKEIVEQDEKESDKRHLLNFGHTIGHALEKLSNYTISHGQAVAIGIMVESYMSVQMGKLKKDSLEKIGQIFAHFGIALKIPYVFTFEKIIEAFRFDKKSISGIPRFVLLEDIGKPFILNGSYCHQVNEEIISKAIDWMNHDLCGN